MDKSDIIPVKFNGKNHVGWSFHPCNFVEGQEFDGYLDGSIVALDAKSKATTSKSTEVSSASTTEKKKKSLAI